MDDALQICEMNELDSPPGTEDEKDMLIEDDVEMLDGDANNLGLNQGLDIEKSKDPEWSSRESLHTPILEIANAAANSEEEAASAHAATTKDQAEELEDGEIVDMDDDERDPAWEPPKKTDPGITNRCVTRGVSGATPNPRTPPEVIHLEPEEDDEALPITPPPDEMLRPRETCPPGPRRRKTPRPPG